MHLLLELYCWATGELHAKEKADCCSQLKIFAYYCWYQNDLVYSFGLIIEIIIESYIPSCLVICLDYICPLVRSLKM